MKNFLNNLLIFLLFLTAIVFFYFAVSVNFSSLLFNIILLFSSIFFVIQGAGIIDRAKGFGKYTDENTTADSEYKDNSNEKNEN